MPVFDPRLLAEWTGGTWQGPPPGRMVGFGIDTRTLESGQVFVAIQTETRDGHGFLEVARAAGAAGALVTRYEPGLDLAQLVVDDTVRALQRIGQKTREGFAGPVIGVTGSSGKTSTKDLLALALGRDQRVHATTGNLNNTLGVPLTLLGLESEKHDFAVIEAGISEVGEMDRLAGMIRPDSVVITMIGASHLEAMKTLETVAVEKARLLQDMGPSGRVFVPEACLRWAPLLIAPTTVVAPVSARLPSSEQRWDSVVRFQSRSTGRSRKIEVRLTDDRRVTIDLQSTSHGMVSNAVLALAVADHLGVDANEAAVRLGEWQPCALRGEILEHSGQLVYLDCYNANPSSMLDAVQAFVDRVGSSVPKLYVIGGMEELGDQSDAWHRKVGRNWPKSPVDRFAIVGAHGAALSEGLVGSGHDASLIEIDDQIDRFRSLIEGWGGAIFIKGSRRYHLERLMDMIRKPRQREGATC